MKKRDIVEAIDWADGFVSESQNSIQAGYEVTLPARWDFPDGDRATIKIKDPDTGAPSPRIQRLLMVAFGACCRLSANEKINYRDFPSIFLSKLKERILSEKISTREVLARVMFDLVRKG